MAELSEMEKRIIECISAWRMQEIEKHCFCRYRNVVFPIFQHFPENEVDEVMSCIYKMPERVENTMTGTLVGVRTTGHVCNGDEPHMIIRRDGAVMFADTAAAAAAALSSATKFAVSPMPPTEPATSPAPPVVHASPTDALVAAAIAKARELRAAHAAKAEAEAKFRAAVNAAMRADVEKNFETIYRDALAAATQYSQNADDIVYVLDLKPAVNKLMFVHQNVPRRDMFDHIRLLFRRMHRQSTGEIVFTVRDSDSMTIEARVFSEAADN